MEFLCEIIENPIDVLLTIIRCASVEKAIRERTEQRIMSEQSEKTTHTSDVVDGELSTFRSFRKESLGHLRNKRSIMRCGKRRAEERKFLSEILDFPSERN